MNIKWLHHPQNGACVGHWLGCDRHDVPIYKIEQWRIPNDRTHTFAKLYQIDDMPVRTWEFNSVTEAKAWVRSR